MNKKAISLLIIIAVLSSLGFIFVADDLMAGLFRRTGDEMLLEYAHGVDRSGNIYFIRKEKDQSYLVSVDSTGRQSYKKNISSQVIGQGIFDNIYVDQDKNLFITVYGRTPNSSRINQAVVYMFRDDGSFVAKIFHSQAERDYDSKFRLISAMSDDDRNLYFGFQNGTTLEFFAYAKGSAEPVKKTGSYSIAQIADRINAFYVLPSGDVVFSLEGGTLLKKSQNEADVFYRFSEQVIVDRFWFAGSQFYFQDAVSGNIYISSASTLEPSLVMKGSKVISEGDGITFAQLSPLTLGSAGNVAGVWHEGNLNRIFLGGFAFLPEIGRTDSSDSSNLGSWFLLAGIMAGIMILSLLIWDFYCHILHMKFSILLRQACLVIWVIFLSLYILTSHIIIPQSTEMIGNVHLTEQMKAGQMVAASCEDYVAAPGGNELDTVQAAAFFEHFRENYALFAAPGNDRAPNSYVNLNKARFSLITAEDGRGVVAASNERYEQGFPAARLGYGTEFTRLIKESENKTINSFEVMTPRGKELCLLMPTGMTFAGSPVLLSMAVELDVLEQYISDMTGAIAFYMGIIGLVLVLLVMLVEYFTVHNVRKLKSSVDRIAQGNYASEIAITSGDEIEDLADSVQDLSYSILATTNSLNKLNQSYYRFVPLRFLEILGETQLENVGKKSQALKENVVMLFLRFRFQNGMGEKTEEIFSNINDVFENVAPVVSEGDGTVYDFLPDGLNALFETRPEDVLRVAIRIREVLEALNTERRGKGRGEVDVRIFVSKGNIMLGFIGEEKRMEPTAISEEAQKAEPIVQICFDSDIYIACTRELLKALPAGVYRSRKIGEVVIREEEIELFDMYDSDPYSLLKAKEVHAQRFDLGVSLFMKKDYTNARNIFMDIIKYSSQDGAARNYMYLAEHNLRSEQKQETYTTIYELEKRR